MSEDLAKAAADAVVKAMSTPEEIAFSSCLDFIDQEMAKYPPGSDEEEDFREQTMMDLFRNAGAPLTLVKQLQARYKGGDVADVTDDLTEVVGLLMFGLKEEPCIPCPYTSIREKILQIGDEAYKELDERKPGNSSFPTLKEEGANESSAKKQRSESESSRSSSGGGDLEGESDEDDEEDSSSSSSSTSKSRKEMNRMIEAKQYVHMDKISQVLQAMDGSTRRRVERLLGLLHAVCLGSEDDCYVLSETFAPMFSRPQGTAYMSIRHLRELPRIRLVLWVWIENFPEVMMLSKEPNNPIAKSAASTPPPGSRHLLAHVIKPRLSSVSSAGIPFSPPNFALHPPVAGEGGELQRGSSRGTSAQHSRRKTPPRMSDLSQRRKIDFELLDAAIASAVDLLFPAITDDEESRNAVKVRFDTWLAEECGQLPPMYKPVTTGKLPEALGEPQSQTPKRQWATRERVIIEKRVLKKRLLHWDKEFEQKNNRKPGKDDRYEMRGVFHAYGALKALLQALEAPNVQANSESLLILEKRALQAVLKLFEKDFEERMGRKVEIAADIAGRELEYSRYKELKETVKAS